MRKVRVLVVDDSVVIRRMLTDVLAQDPEIEVVGVAANGKIALSKLPLLTPDVITLDIEMPEMDGLATLTELRKDYPKMPVIMFSTLTSRGAAATFDALARGASDYVAKPANVGSVAAGMQSVKEQLIPKIKALSPFYRPASTAPAKLPPRSQMAGAAKPRPTTCEVLLIGSSTGGPQALGQVLRALPASLPVPVLVVQHMPPLFTKHLASRLNQESPLSVKESQGGEVLAPGEVLVAPGDFHLELCREGTRVKTILTQSPPENSCRPAVDVLFRSASEVYGQGCLGVVLTGMGRDGMLGSDCVVRAGGRVVAQDEATSVVWGMPRAVVEAGLADKILPLNAIPNEITRLVSIGRKQLITC